MVSGAELCHSKCNCRCLRRLRTRLQQLDAPCCICAWLDAAFLFSHLGCAQALSARPDLLPKPYLDALADLQDRLQPFPTEIAITGRAWLWRRPVRLLDQNKRRHVYLRDQEAGMLAGLARLRVAQPPLPCEPHPHPTPTPFVPFLLTSVIEEELGRPLGAMFSEFSEKPVAAASLGG